MCLSLLSLCCLSLFPQISDSAMVSCPVCFPAVVFCFSLVVYCSGLVVFCPAMVVFCSGLGSSAPPWWSSTTPVWWFPAPPWWAPVPSAPPWWAPAPSALPWWALVPSAPPRWAPVPSSLPWLPALPQSPVSHLHMDLALRPSPCSTSAPPPSWFHLTSLGLLFCLALYIPVCQCLTHACFRPLMLIKPCRWILTSHVSSFPLQVRCSVTNATVRSEETRRRGSKQTVFNKQKRRHNSGTQEDIQMWACHTRGKTRSMGAHGEQNTHRQSIVLTITPVYSYEIVGNCGRFLGSCYL